MTIKGQAIRDIDEFVFFITSDLEKCIIISLAQQRIHWSEWVPWERESNQLIKKHHNNPQVIHTTPVHQLKSGKVKSCSFLRKKNSILRCFILQIIVSGYNTSPLSTILLPPVKMSSGLNQERNVLRLSTVYQRKQSKIVLNKYAGGF